MTFKAHIENIQAKTGISSEDFLKRNVATRGLNTSEVRTLKFMLYPYKVNFCENENEADVLIGRPNGDKTDSKPQITMAHNPLKENQGFLAKNLGNGIAVYDYDLIGVCCQRFNQVLRPKLSLKYKLSTKLPLQYNIIPSSVRSLFLKLNPIDYDLGNHVFLEMLRRHLLDAFKMVGQPLERKKKPKILVTHDVDSQRGIERAVELKKIEVKLGIESLWFIVSDEYDVPRKIAKELGEGSFIGSHDTKHDGRLIRMSNADTMVRRLRSSREKLETMFEKEVISFRSPLLQFSERIISSLDCAGYKFDFSLPSWEPIHPSTMCGFGIESFLPFEVDGIVETPLTMFQDHQVLNVLDLSAKEAIKLWLRQAAFIKYWGGDLVLLVHPDYLFGGDPSSYHELLAQLYHSNNDDVRCDEGAKLEA